MYLIEHHLQDYILSFYANFSMGILGGHMLKLLLKLN